jgi:hypothetical protein
MRDYSDDSDDERSIDSYSKEEEFLLKLDEDSILYDGGSVSIYTLKHFIQ